MEADNITAWISEKRFASFLESAGGEEALATQLYLWRTRLRHAFPGAGLRREILEPLTNLHLWRNRIAHHDSLLDQNLERRLSEMIGVANAIDPACGKWLAAHTQLMVLLKQRPVAK